MKKEEIMQEKAFNQKELHNYSLLTEAASLYYEKGMTQADIADRLCVSRTRISRMLTKAQELGIVQIQIRHFLERNYAAEERLCQRFGLKQALIFDSAHHSPQDIHREVCALASRYLSQQINRRLTIGISVGRSVADTIDGIKPQAPCAVDVVQIMGFAATQASLPDYNGIASRLASKYGGIVHYLNTPLLVPDLYVKQQILSDPLISKTLRLAINADMVLTGIGSIDDFLMDNPWMGYMTPEIFQQLRRQGAVGCIGARFFDQNGQVLSNEWNNRCIGLELEDIKRMHEVVAVSCGREKTQAIHAALCGRLINVLVTDYASVECFL